MIRPVLGKMKVVGISPRESAADINIYPNPTSDGKVRIDLPPDFKAEELITIVYSISGGKLIEKPFSTDEDFGTLSRGIYLLQVARRDGSVAARGKLIIR